MSSTGSSLPRRMLGRQLRELRIKSGVSAEAARKALDVGKQTLWRMETGQSVRLYPLFIERLCKLYKASDEQTAILLDLVEETKHTEWWYHYDDAIPKGFSHYVGLEAAARRVFSYQTTLLPGLLQTNEYRRALIWVDYPTMPGPEVERRIEVFTRRKARLDSDSDPLSLNVIIDESALRRPIGGRSVMGDQVAHLARVSEHSNISVLVVPLESEAYPGLRVGPFVMLEFPKHPTAHLTEPPIIYMQGFTGDLYLEKPEEVRGYRHAWADIERSALDEAHSRSLLRKIAKEYAE
ncbi:helix-turn-helix domain-containing protein [Nocardia pneumoniae]|uniref:helix-turn-helix domain-containing protein n=1 Tax=Nocardia pneumoniae TaxID=228601 RepID=UPI0005940B1A|nr:helix-turn-helix transcriptional regulator [Nocardia pneumoniae]